ncbi:PREDICTED: probable G-protein coupled receptor 125 [Ceratosolen solmsi marchali]|uniref:Probable G-protein coupled receptor 125 n=1 Tax=Ceratosolen solmsi marchali TaxID=326594 RepID=A0AAJ6YFS6_9HYME|nr:PREDICTED: probable G-protein coupled receptor 125 [Ceratosolen solmsi marchali]
MFKIILVLSFLQGFFSVYCKCPSQCYCRHIKPQAEWLKVVCKDKIEDIKEIDFNLISIEMIHLFNIFRAINGNKIEILKEGTFHGLSLLKELDVSANPWNCDCNLFWFSYWIQNNSIKLSPPPECYFPLSLKGKLVKKLQDIKASECKWSTPTIEIVPEQNQVVFAGDTITLKCHAPSITSDRFARLSWLWNSNITSDILDLDLYDNPQNIFINVEIKNKYIDNSGIISSSLSINPVTEEHNGQWNCLLVSAYGNISRVINVIVISNHTQYCPLTVTRSNKGVYAWPRTIVGWTVELPCEGSSLPVNFIQFLPRASYECNSTGYWQNLNTKSCPYVSATTKILEQFSTVNMSLTKLSLPKGSLLETIKKLKNITGEGVSLTDPIEINFVTKILENYVSYLVEEKELGTMLIDVVNVLLNLPKSMLKAAEISYEVCTRIIKTVELIVETTPSSQLIQLHKKNMALEKYRVKADNFVGLTCTWYSNSQNIYVKLLHCSMSNKTTIVNTNAGETMIEASVQLPASLFQNIKSSTLYHQLMVSMYTNNKLFPKLNDKDNIDVTSSIVGSKIIGTVVHNLTEPVYIMLKAPLIRYASSKPIPVVWNTSLNNKTGGWTSDGCHLSNFLNNLIIFHCDRLGYYGLLQDKSFVHKNGRSITGAKFKYSNPAIYAGSFILVVCLICTTVTYICCYTSIAMPKKAKHCIINTWIIMALLCFLYSSGIQQTDNVEICRVVGIGLHYLSLCCLFWMTVSASNMYKRLSKSTMDSMTDDDGLREKPIRKPLFGLYLVGWGIALIICGISGAINLREHGNYSYCFFTSTPSLAALFVPATVLLIYLTILHMLIRCSIRNVDLNGQLSEGTQATENVDLELLEPNPNLVCDRISLHSSQAVSSEVEDQEHSQMTQLKGLIVVMILYLIAWLCAAMTTGNILFLYMPYKETLFAILYAISASSLGMFILLFYGIARSDVRAQWLNMGCWLKQKNRCCRTRNIYDTNLTIPIQPLVSLTAAHLSNSQAMQVISDSISLGSSRNTQKSQSSCNTFKLISNESNHCHVRSNFVANADLVILHRQQYRSNNTATTFNTESVPASVERFYNPHQSGVARKFFKKQRRDMMNSNFASRKQNDGGTINGNERCISIRKRSIKLDGNIESSILGSSAKVNNTNIHVEINPVNYAKNINILSDIGESISEDRNLSLRYVIGQEKLGKNIGIVNTDVSIVQNGACRPKYQLMTNYATCISPYKSVKAEMTIGMAKKIRNASQRFNLECNSEIESTSQLVRKRSEHSISQLILSKSINISCTKLNIDETISKEKDQKNMRFDNLCNRCSGSLSSLPLNQRSIITLRNRYRSSFNDLTCLENLPITCDRLHLERILFEPNCINSLEKQNPKIRPFSVTTLTAPTSDNIINLENKVSGNVTKVMIAVVKDDEPMLGNIVELYDLDQRNDENSLREFHKKLHHTKSKEHSREMPDNNHEHDKLTQTKINIKKETSV